MGVKDLWSILEPTHERKLLRDFEGKTVAVDLGYWVCQMKTAVANPTVVKPHLRNLFFRISALLQLQICPVFVLDGAPPDIKQDAMHQRQDQRSKNRNEKQPFWAKKKNSNHQQNGTRKMQRGRFQAELKECGQLIKMLGFLVIESSGEAEATCATLNRIGIVDAVVTDDGDAFLYGANCVFRNFSLEGKEPMIDVYYARRIQQDLGLNREKLIVLGLLIGCDYCTKGVPGVGREMALKYVNGFWDGEAAIDRLKSWRETGATAENKAEAAILKRVSDLSNFPDQRIIDEFLKKEESDSNFLLPQWNQPDFTKLVIFLNLKIEWEESYAVAKVIPLVSLWNLVSLRGKTISRPTLTPVRIVKDRIRLGVPCFEVQWHKLGFDSFTEEQFYITLESVALFEKAFPEMTSAHKDAVTAKKSLKGKKGKKSKKAPTIEIETLTTVASVPDDDVLDNSIICIDDDPENEALEEFRRSFLESSSAEEEVCLKTTNGESASLTGAMESISIKGEVETVKTEKPGCDSPFLTLKERMKLRGILV